VSDDPADVFISIFDQVPEDLFLGSKADLLSEDATVRHAADQIYGVVVTNGKASPTLTELPTDDTRDAVAMARLNALDRVLRTVHPNAGAPAPAKLAGLAARYTRHGHLNTDLGDGLLIPRLMDYSAAKHRADKYERFSVVRVEPDRMKNIRFISLGTRAWPTVTSSDDLLVACLPFLDAPGDVELDRFADSGGSWYRLGPSDDDALERRVDDAIAALDASGAPVALLPECALSEKLLSIWQRRLAATYPTSRSRLALVIAGTGPVTNEDPPRNRAVVLDREGCLLWEQDKLCDYTIEEYTWNRWKLPHASGGEVKEYITRGSELIVVETTIGRLAILICEDLQRCDTRRVVPRDLGVSHILVPVFDSPLADDRWHRDAAKNYMDWIGSRVVVSNSRVVGNLQGNAPKMNTAISLSPFRDPKGRYPSQLGTTESAIDIAKVAMPALGPLP